MQISIHLQFFWGGTCYTVHISGYFITVSDIVDRVRIFITNFITIFLLSFQFVSNNEMEISSLMSTQLQKTICILSAWLYY